ncbi:NAD(P)H-dependent flavin oxidoreductase [Brevibacillus sp. NRS-1366]|uniref:NAD(P)H-dependent flavin oxidoreductase n=1 Tax=Brevibacillus sp. NRS-1366 TaxID=3233899 RepID=UPI003D23E4CA
MFRTRITEMFGIKVPLIQAGMHRLGRTSLAAAVANAGGLGVITAGSFNTKEELLHEIRETRRLTSNPIALNISIGRRRSPEMYFDVAVEERIPIVFTSGANPSDYVGRLKNHGIMWVHAVTSVKHALKVQELGADAVVATGYEAGGHPGLDQVSTFVLVPSIVDAVRIPVIAAGGISDGRGLAAGLALGAEAVMVGTRFILSDESLAHENIKSLYLQAKETDTVIIETSIRKNHRVIHTTNADKVIEMEINGAGIDELLTVVGGEAYIKMMEQGDISAGVTSCGQGVGLVKTIKPAGEIVHEFVTVSSFAIKRLTEALGSGLKAK